MSDRLSINPNRLGVDETYLRIAEIIAQRSKANRKQVGAVLLKNNQMVSDGYNGMPAGEADDVCEYIDENGELRTKPEVLHAESNALMKLAKADQRASSDGATLYQTLSPCIECAKLIKQAGIVRVVFREYYRDTKGIEFLQDRGVQVDYRPKT